MLSELAGLAEVMLVIRGGPKLGFPYWGPYYKGILFVGLSSLDICIRIYMHVRTLNPLNP